MKQDRNARIYKTASVAAILEISTKTLRRKLKDGTFPEPARHEKRWRYWTEQDIEEMKGLMKPSR